MVAGGEQGCLLLSWCSDWGIGRERRRERKGVLECDGANANNNVCMLKPKGGSLLSTTALTSLSVSRGSPLLYKGWGGRC